MNYDRAKLSVLIEGNITVPNNLNSLYTQNNEQRAFPSQCSHQLNCVPLLCVNSVVKIASRYIYQICSRCLWLHYTRLPLAARGSAQTAAMRLPRVMKVPDSNPVSSHSSSKRTAIRSIRVYRHYDVHICLQLATKHVRNPAFHIPS
jgi:hypothetical protein